MKRILTCFLLFMSVCSVFGQQDEIILDKDEVKKEIDDILFTFLVKHEPEKGYATLTIKMKNNHPERDVVIFPKSWDSFKTAKKVLKKHDPPIVLSESMANHGSPNYYEGLEGEKIVVIRHDESKEPIVHKDKRMDYGEAIQETLTYYLAKPEGKESKRKYLIDTLPKEVTLIIRMGPDYATLKQRVDSLEQAIHSVILCTDERHQPNLNTQKHEWLDKIDDLKNEISSKTSNMMGDAGRKFRELEQRLDNIKFNEGRCDLHPELPCETNKGYCCKHPDHRCGKCCTHVDGFACKECNRKCKTDPGYCCKHPNHRCGKCCTHDGYKCQNPGCKKTEPKTCTNTPGYCCIHKQMHNCGKCCTHTRHNYDKCKICHPNPPCCKFSSYDKEQVTEALRNICVKKSRITKQDCSRAELLIQHARHKGWSSDSNIKYYYNKIKIYCP